MNKVSLKVGEGSYQYSKNEVMNLYLKNVISYEKYREIMKKF